MTVRNGRRREMTMVMRGDSGAVVARAAAMVAWRERRARGRARGREWVANIEAEAMRRMRDVREEMETLRGRFERLWRVGRARETRRREAAGGRGGTGGETDNESVDARWRV